MQPLVDWCNKHGVPQSALPELVELLGIAPGVGVPESQAQINGNAFLRNEMDVQNAVRIRAGESGCLLMRNNVGVLPDANGRPVRFGLANDSKKLNQTFKSSDLIGITPVPVQGAGYIGVFTALECKAPGWVFTGSQREVAQAAFHNRVRALGGIAGFVSDPKQLDGLIPR